MNMRGLGSLRKLREFQTVSGKLVNFYLDQSQTGVVASVNGNYIDLTGLYVNVNNSNIHTKCFTDCDLDFQMKVVEKAKQIDLTFSNTVLVTELSDWDWCALEKKKDSEEGSSSYRKLRQFLESEGAFFREVFHKSEGRCDVVSQIRGNNLCQAMKALVLMAMIDKRTRKYYLVVIPGDRSLDMEVMKRYAGVQKIMFAPKEKLQELTQCEPGTVPPFSFVPELHLVVDPTVKDNREIVFNAGRLDCSFFMDVAEYVKVANPTFVSVVSPQENKEVNEEKEVLNTSVNFKI